MKQITEITRRDIFSLFLHGMDIAEYTGNIHIDYKYYGRLTEIDFLKRTYDLRKLPSHDSRFKDAEGDIWNHVVNNNDYEDGWLLEDERFGLLDGEDEVFLQFLCSVFHPAVRVESGLWGRFLNEINGYLRNNGYELYPESKISEHNVYGWRVYEPETNASFIPFSKRNEKEIRAKKLKLSLPMKVRKQILELFEEYSVISIETSKTGWQSTSSTEEYVFRDISRFYKPMCYDASGDYTETTDMDLFILHNSPFCVLDAIEFFEKHNTSNDFATRVNALFKSNNMAYKMKHGRIVSTFGIVIDKNTLSEISENGLKELLSEANKYYQKDNKKIAVEKLWDAFERLKTYYSPALNKAASADKIVDDMSASEPHYQALYKAEFKALTDIGNNFRIRHHETTKIDITDNRQYDYFYKRCLALISVAILYLERG